MINKVTIKSQLLLAIDFEHDLKTIGVVSLPIRIFSLQHYVQVLSSADQQPDCVEQN